MSEAGKMHVAGSRIDGRIRCRLCGVWLREPFAPGDAVVEHPGRQVGHALILFTRLSDLQEPLLVSLCVRGATFMVP